MKHLDNFSKRMIVAGMVMVAVLLSGSLFMLSIGRLQATGNSSFAPAFVNNSAEGNGKYVVSTSISYTPSGTQAYYTFIMNSETGISRQYFWDSYSSEFTLFPSQIPQVNF